METAAGAIDPDGTLALLAIGVYLFGATLVLSPVLSVAFALFRERWPFGRSVAAVALLWVAATATYAVAVTASPEHAWQLAVAVYAQAIAVVVVVVTVSRPVGGVLSSEP